MDLLLSRYGISVLDLDVEIGVELIKTAYEKQADEILFNMWNLDRIFMDKDNFESFQGYKDKAYKKTSQPPKPKMTKEQIYKQADTIIAAWKHKK